MNEAITVTRAYNARILKEIKRQGFESLRAFCDHSKIHYGSACNLVAYRTTPIHHKSKKWSKSAIGLSNALSMPPEYFWQELSKHPTKKGKVNDLADHAEEFGHLAGIIKHPPAYSQIIKQEDKEAVKDIISILSDKKQDMIRMYFGLDPYGSPQTLKTIALKHRCSSVNVGNCIASSLRKVRNLMSKDKMSLINDILTKPAEMH